MTPKTFYSLVKDARASGAIDDPAYIGYAHYDESRAGELVSKNGISHLLTNLTCYDHVLQLLFTETDADLPLNMKEDPMTLDQMTKKLEKFLPVLGNTEIETNLGSIDIFGYELENIEMTDYIVLYDS